MTSRGIRVLQVIDSLGMGGAETWLMELLRLWAKSGRVQMNFLLTGGHHAIFDEEAVSCGAQVFYERYERRYLKKFTSTYRQILRNGRYHAIHDHADYVSGWHFLLGLGVLPKVRVTHIHNPWLHISDNYAVTPTRKLMTRIGRQLVNVLATDVCGTSVSALNNYGFGIKTDRRPYVQVLHCGIDVAKFSASRERDRESILQEFGFPRDSKIILFAGRLDRSIEFDHPKNHKNSSFAIHVARSALKIDASIRLLMAGAGEESRQKLESCIHEWSLQDQLRLIGVRKDIARLMRAADILLFPSRQEGLGMVAVEAQATGLPVLASDAVPRECVVIPELYESLSLDVSIDRWAQTLLQQIQKPRLTSELCGLKIERSPFSIINSARRLEAIYGRGVS